MSLFLDANGQVSWGRICALVALIVAVIGQFRGMDMEHLKLWLGVAVGNYGLSKLTEMVARVGAAASSGTGGAGVVPTSQPTDGAQ